MRRSLKFTLSSGVAVIGLALGVPMIAQTPGSPPLAHEDTRGPQFPVTQQIQHESPPRWLVDKQLSGLNMPLPGQESVGPGAAIPRQLSLADLQEIAMRQHPALAQAAARVQAVQGRWVQAGLRPNPSLGYSGQEIGNDGTAGVHGLFVAREYITGNKLGLAQSTVAAEINAAVEAMRTTEIRVMADVRRAYINALVAQERLRLAQEILHISEDLVRVADELLRAKEGTLADKLQSQNEASSSSILVDNALAERDGAWRSLSVAIGGQALSPEPLAGTLEGTVPQFEWQSTLNRIFSENPLLASADAQIAAARWNLRRQTAEPIPNVNVQAGVAHSYISSDTFANVQLSVPIPINDANQGAILAARGNLIAAERERDRIMLSLEQQLANVFADYQAATRQVEWYEREILQRAQSVLELRMGAYQAGEEDYTAILTSQRLLFDYKRQYLLSLQNAHLAAARIEYLLLDDALRQ